MSKLYVKFCGVNPAHRGVPTGIPEEKRERRGDAWRVCVDDGDDIYSSTLGFRRQRDAEMAMAALNRAGVVDLQTLVAIPFTKRNRIMLEALQW